MDGQRVFRFPSPEPIKEWNQGVPKAQFGLQEPMWRLVTKLFGLLAHLRFEGGWGGCQGGRIPPVT